MKKLIVILLLLTGCAAPNIVTQVDECRCVVPTWYVHYKDKKGSTHIIETHTEYSIGDTIK